jgi:hypothetical protein
MELTTEIKVLLKDAAEKLKGTARRTFMARTVKMLGRGGQRRAERELGWDRTTIRKGTHELESGIKCIDAFALRGRKKAEEHLPNLLNDIRSLVDGQSQIDPTFRTERLYTRLSAAEVRKQLITQKGYTEELPTVQTINSKLNELGYRLKAVAKTKPLKKIPETDAIFDQLEAGHAASAEDETTLRLSLDAKARVKVGPFSRRGRSRVRVAAADHDFTPDTTVTPFGILLPDLDELFLYLATSKVTSDFIVDVLADWWAQVQVRFPMVKTLQLDLDNGPENNSHRTQFICRLIEFSKATSLNLELAYYPPYHSKYNPIERCWAVLENHWNGSLLDTVETVVQFAKTMTWRGEHPIVTLVTRIYETGVKLTKQAMQACEEMIERRPTLEKWFVKICPSTA